MTEDPRPTPGTRLVFRWRKWDGGVHWAHESVYLGSDRWGDWFGQVPGSISTRPGRRIVVAQPNVTLLPASGEYAYSHNAAPATYETYIDLAWDARWEGHVPTGIDMDLDVVRTRDGRGLWIDDRDEWDEHRVRYGYPLGIVDRLEALAVDLERRVGASEPPFDDATAQHWLARLAELAPGETSASPSDGATPPT